MLPVIMPKAGLVIAAVIPAVLLMLYVYRLDKIEKEPVNLLLKLLLKGIYATGLAIAAETLGLWLIGKLSPPALVDGDELTLLGAAVFFLIVGFGEEGAKYFVLRRATWGIPDFNYRFDGVVYAAAVSLGFALWENIFYVLNAGWSTALMRAVTAVPAHACFGVFMGCWYANAYVCHMRGDESRAGTLRRLTVIVPALTHGLYDFIAYTASLTSEWIFVVFVIILFLTTLIMTRRFARRDAEV